MATYHRRTIDDELDTLVDAPAIAIDGPKAVGKTTTAQRRAAVTIRLDDPTERELVAADPSRLSRSGTVLLDEWQRWSPSWDVVRRFVDDSVPTRFLLTGSAPPADAPVHTGAGRILTLRMRPLSLAERGLASPTVGLANLISGTGPPIGGDTSVALPDYAEEIVASGFPAIRSSRGRLRRGQLDGYLERIVRRDLPEAGFRVRRPAALSAWMTAYAAATATTSSYEKILRATLAGIENPPTKPTALGYRDVLIGLWMLDPLEAWLPTRNRLARLGQAPKHHLADPALAARLLGVSADGLLTESGGSVHGPLLGRLFESLVTLSVQTYAQAAETRVRHLRTRDGDHEVDLILERPDGRVLAVEVKLGATVGDDDVKHLLWLRNRIADDLVDSVVVTTGPYAYRRPDGIAVVPAALLGP